MDTTKAKEYVKLLSNLYPNSALAENDGTKTLYKEYFAQLNERYLDKAIEGIKIKNKFCPSISEIDEVYSRYFSQRATETFEDCPYCNNQGYILYKQEIDGMIYEFLAYCDKCKRGEQFAYDGRNCKDRPSDYVVPSATSIIPEQFLKENKVEETLSKVVFRSKVNELTNKFAI